MQLFKYYDGYELTIIEWNNAIISKSINKPQQ